MNKKPLTRTILGVCALAVMTLSACTPDEPEENKAGNSLLWLNEPPIGLTDQWRVQSNPQLKAPWLAYYHEKSSLFLRDPSGKSSMLVDGAAGGAPSGIALGLNAANTPATMWRDKVPSKGLFFKQGDLPALEIGVESLDTEPLARFDLAADGSQGWHTLWYGERFIAENNSKYNLYYRHVGTDGKLSPVDVIMPGFYPQWAIAPDNTVSIFSWDSTQNPPRIIMRQRDATSGQFGAVHAVATTTSDIPPLMRSVMLGDRLVVMWVDMRGEDKRDMLLRGMWSDDKGSQWTEFSFPTLRGFDITDYRLARDTQGHVILAISGSWRLKDPQAMESFYLTSSTDNGTSWSEPKVIRDAAANETSRATAAQVFFGNQPGEAWAAWEDWRDVRGRLYFAYSDDAGVSWKHSNLPLAGQPDGNNVLAVGFDQGYRDSTGQHLVAANITTDMGEGKRLFSLPLDKTLLDASVANKPKASIMANEQALKKRVEGFRKAMADSDYAGAYAYFDPFMRSAWPLELYKQRLGRIKFKPEVFIDSININGNFADVNARIRAYVPEFEIQGKKQSMPEREIPISERWVFVDGGWYREYSEEGSEIRFTRYR